jgi:hypothetical protein
MNGSQVSELETLATEATTDAQWIKGTMKSK